ncbi:hypothetical protein SOVF_105880 [Spinacia oleracea]|uniref:Uncharacterized protein isoform X1 n=1 Tax=Spinacia oleracea TaxID=3562 RepID=A0ABM3RRW8_SPIOL|nr:uncharacterized protein LOC110795866 isoform X1 [Spinacia oleracea]XP_056698366.1 uncharacterized protein LOC110795866 isoform X1 [Spinacia oleracea]XP_056698368.1 uncharacterized protein LOC110795866 isoform X1 [Spinacia oleracea]XP_056698373.1 uncharacterized protein LOC110795866 isoform X1 [Spinacia oleracea]XP_056698378.1 uncharacterized protein LOC110795866 isoform X1 [Spinacia oleracea]KNA14525.1 hypothetical protein SOVF_105880 [Spinacia oleracea]
MNSDEFENKILASKKSIGSGRKIHCRCEPVVDVYSVKLNTNSSESCDVYGDINLFDMKGDSNTCMLYRRQANQPQVIPPNHGYLRLQGPRKVPPLDKPFIAMDIREKTTGKSIVEGSTRLIKSIDNDDDVFEQFGKVSISSDGSGASATVDYLALRYAVFAAVRIDLLDSNADEVYDKPEDDDDDEDEEDKDEEEVLEVYGKVTANFSLYSTEEVYRVSLFDCSDESNMMELVVLGTDLSLSRSLLVVPPYSPLVIEVDLTDAANDDALIVNDSVSFEPDNLGYNQKFIKGSNGVDV